MQLASRRSSLPSSYHGAFYRGRLGRKQVMSISAKGGLKIPNRIKKIEPKGDLVYVKCDPEEEKTLGGILLPGSATRKPTSGTVVELGDGRTGNSENYEFTVKKGDSVLYSKFGFAYTELTFKDDDYLLIQEDEVIGIMPQSNPTADDVVELKPLSDRVLIKVDEVSDVTLGGVMLPESAKDRPLSGIVVRTGPGKCNEDGKIEPFKVKKDDKVLYFKYAGENMETTKGEQFVVIRENDILCKT